MNKICILARNFETYFIKRLSEEIGNERLIRFNPWLEARPEQVVNQVLVRSSGVYGSDRDLAWLSGQSDKNIINPLWSLTCFRQKSTQYGFLADHEFCHLPWMSFEQASEEKAQEMSRDTGARKVLVKPDRGQGGWGQKVLLNREVATWKKQKIAVNDTSYLFQPYLEGYQEYRVFFIRDQLQIVLKRRSLTGGPANFAQAGEAELALLPDAILPEVKRLIARSQAYYGAIDLLIGTNNYYFLELNVVPGIEQLEAVSGVNIIRQLLAANFFCQLF
jgi:glutathione synthase/RimK-type ligase-like ATP-grasp enzyme